MENVKIVFVDLDGTLKDNEGKVSIRNKKIFEKLTDKGINIVIATGRSLPDAMTYSKQFSTSNYIISSNGAEIYNYVTKETIHRSIIEKEDVLMIDELVKKYDLFFIANCLDKTYTNKPYNEPGKKVATSLKEIEENISQIIVESYNIEKMKLFRRDFGNIEHLKISNKSRNPESTDEILFYDITCNEVSKGLAATKLCEYLNIDMDKTMAIGDSNNDLEMLQNAKIKVAMNNATEDIKKIANYITLSNEQEGVAVILEKLYSEINN